jgi:hypothetical protein
MNGRARDLPGQNGEGRSERETALDLEVGLRVEEYRWVEWNRRALGRTPLHEPGRFVGHPGDLLAHLYEETSEDTPLSEDAYARLPRYSTRTGPALRAAERAGVFADEGARLSCTPGGVWHLSLERAGLDLENESLPRLLCRAALRLADRRAGGARG